MGIWRYTEAAPDLTPYLNPLNQRLDGVDKTANQTAAELQKYLAEQNAGQSGGKSLSVTFEGTGFLPDTLFQDPQYGIGCKSGKADITWPNDPGHERQFLAAIADPLTGDDQSAVVTVSGALDIYNSDTGHPTSILLCVNSTITQGFIAKFSRDRVEYGYFNGITSDGQLSYGALKSWTVTVPTSPTLEFRRSGNVFTLMVNGNTVGTHAPAAGTLPAFTGANYRRTGFGLHAGWGAVFSGRSTPITSFTTSDISVPAMRGAGWMLSRTNTGNTALSGSDFRVFPPNTFDGPAKYAGVELYGPAGGGGVRILRSDWYSMTLVAKLVSAAGSSYQFVSALFRSETAGAPAVLYRRGFDTTGSQEFRCFGSFTEYLQAGNVIYPAMYQAGSNSVDNGDAAGTITYFTGFARG